MTEKELEEMKQKYGFTLHPSAFNGKPIKYVTKEEYEEKINKVWNQIYEDDSDEGGFLKWHQEILLKLALLLLALWHSVLSLSKFRLRL